MKSAKRRVQGLFIMAKYTKNPVYILEHAKELTERIKNNS